MFRAVLAGILLFSLAHCDSPKTPPKSAADRVAKAEAAMEECKKRQGLEAIPTPAGVVLDDPATRGQEMTPELAGQLRLKIQCRLELDELLAARKP
jgi:hypothetical protein